MTFFNTQPHVEEPVTVEAEGPHRKGETKTTHPAFGQISASRISGRTNLYGSDFSHNGFINITIKASELHRNLSNDWHFDREQLIQIAMSEAQWATFVSSLNNGGGVPCTLEWIKGEGRLPGLPDPKSRADQFGKEFHEDFAEALEALDSLVTDLEASGMSKKKIDAFVSKARTAAAKINSAAPFVADQFGEHMESEIENAKIEIHGYAQQLFQRAGVAALAGPEGPLALGLEDKRDEA